VLQHADGVMGALSPQSVHARWAWSAMTWSDQAGTSGSAAWGTVKAVLPPTWRYPSTAACRVGQALLSGSVCHIWALCLYPPSPPHTDRCPAVSAAAAAVFLFVPVLPVCVCESPGQQLSHQPLSHR